MRPALVVLVWLLSLGIVQGYLVFVRNIPGRETETIRELSADGSFAVELSLTFDAAPDEFTKDASLELSINGKSLPYISWNNGELQHTLQLARQLGLLDQMMGANPNMDQLTSTIDQFLPIVQAAELNLVVNFPQ